MAVTALRTVNVRNLQNQDLDFTGKNILLIGENGQGKTNILESIYYLCYGTSFREKSDSRVVCFGKDGMSIFGHLQTRDGQDNEVAVKIRDKGKHIFLNNRKISDRKELIYTSPCIVFSHEDIQYIKGPLQQKRHFINQILGLYDPVYLEFLRNYTKTVKIKNTLLKDRQYDLIPLYHRQISEFGIELQKKRKACLVEFNETLRDLFGRVSELPGELSLDYSPSWKGCKTSEDGFSYLQEHTKNDRKYFTSTNGPHRDRITVRYDERDFSSYASTGQTRLVALLLKVAQAGFFTRKTGKTPILLLDDVFLEMDPKRKDKFLSVFPENEQCFFTFLPGDSLLDMKRQNSRLFRVQSGKVSAYE